MRGPIGTRVWLVVNIGTFNACICRNTASISASVMWSSMVCTYENRFRPAASNFARTWRKRSSGCAIRHSRSVCLVLVYSGVMVGGRLAEAAAVDDLRSALWKYRDQLDVDDAERLCTVR